MEKEQISNAMIEISSIEEEDFAWYIDKKISKSRIEAIKIINKVINNYVELEEYIKDFKSKVIKQKEERARTKLTESPKLNALEKFCNILLEKLEGEKK